MATIPLPWTAPPITQNGLRRMHHHAWDQRDDARHDAAYLTGELELYRDAAHTRNLIHPWKD